MTFTEDYALHMQFLHNDPLIMNLQISNCKILEDTVSSIDMMYKATLDKIGLGMTDIRACTTTPYGFSGE